MKRKHNPRSNNLTREAQRRGGIVNGQRRRAAAMARLKDLTPVQIWRAAFSAGWAVGVRSARRRMGLAA